MQPATDYAAGMLNASEIKRRREKLGLTMQEAAERSGVGSRQHWNRLESGLRKSVSLETAVNIARTLRCKVDDLLEKRQ